MSKKRRRERKSNTSPPQEARAEQAGRQNSLAGWRWLGAEGRGYQLVGLNRVALRVRLGLWLLLILLAPFYSVFQGVDLTDVGVMLTDAYTFFAMGEHTKAGSTFLSVAITAVWMSLFGGLGVVGIKLGNVAISWASAALVYWALHRSFRREPVLVALAVTSCFINARSLVQWMNYDTLSGLFYTAGVACLIRGLVSRQRLLIGSAGFVFLLLKYIRMPSILGLGFVVAVPLYYWLRGRPLEQCKGDLLAFGVGVLSGLVVMVAIGLVAKAPLVIPKTAQPVEQIDGLEEVSDEAKERDRLEKGYNVKEMALRLWHEYWGGTKDAFPIALVMALLAVSMVKMPKLGPIVLLASGATAYVWLFKENPRAYFVNSMLAASLGFAFLGLGKRAPTQSMMVFLAFAMLACSPAGSNTGLAKASHGMWFAIPLVLLCPFRWQHIPIPFRKIRLPGQPFAAAALVLGVMLFGGSLFLGWQNSYRDHPDRSKMNTSIDHPKLRLLYTLPERARVLQELLDNYEAHIAPDELMVTIGSVPGLHYIMQRQKYLPRAWTDQMHSMKTGKLRPGGKNAWVRAIHEHGGSAPILLTARGSCRNPVWPLQKQPLRKASTPIKLPYNDVVYKLAWEGEFFLIYRPHDVPVAKAKK